MSDSEREVPCVGQDGNAVAPWGRRRTPYAAVTEERRLQMTECRCKTQAMYFFFLKLGSLEENTIFAFIILASY